MRTKLRFSAMALGAALGALALPISAPADLGLDVSPAKLEISIAPGRTYNIPLTVHNSSAQTTHVVATMVDFGVAPNGDYQIERVGTRRYSLMRWASINPREFDLPAGTTQQVRLTLAIPPGNRRGEYAGIVFFQTRPTRRGGGVAFSARVGTKIYETIPGTVRRDGAITKMSSTGDGIGRRYRVLFKNRGDAHVYLRGTLQIQKDGATVERIVLRSEALVERGGERLIEVSGKKLPAGWYRAIAEIDYGGKTLTGGEISFDVR